jgi:small multidrug resistance pump
MPYLLLSLAIAVEVGATVTLKFSEGFTRLAPTVISLIGYGVSFFLLALALRHIPVSVAYAIWSGAGTAAVAAIGFTFLREPVSAVKLAGIVLIIGGVVLLNAGGVRPAN